MAYKSSSKMLTSQDGGQLLHHDRGPRGRRTPTASLPRTRYGPGSRKYSPAAHRWRTRPGTEVSGTLVLLNLQVRVQVTRRFLVTRRFQVQQSHVQRFRVLQVRLRGHPRIVGRVASAARGSCAAARDSLTMAAMDKWVERTCTFVSQRLKVSVLRQAVLFEL